MIPLQWERERCSHHGSHCVQACFNAAFLSVAFYCCFNHFPAELFIESKHRVCFFVSVTAVVVLWGTMLLFPALRHTVWLIGLLQGGLFEWHVPFGWEVVLPQVLLWQQTCIIVKRYSLHKYSTFHLIAENFKVLVCQWLLNEMFIQQEFKSTLTNIFI